MLVSIFISRRVTMSERAKPVNTLTVLLIAFLSLTPVSGQQLQPEQQIPQSNIDSNTQTSGDSQGNGRPMNFGESFFLQKLREGNIGALFDYNRLGTPVTTQSPDVSQHRLSKIFGLFNQQIAGQRLGIPNAFGHGNGHMRRIGSRFGTSGLPGQAHWRQDNRLISAQQRWRQPVQRVQKQTTEAPAVQQTRGSHVPSLGQHPMNNLVPIAHGISAHGGFNGRHNNIAGIESGVGINRRQGMNEANSALLNNRNAIASSEARIELNVEPLPGVGDSSVSADVNGPTDTISPTAPRKTFLQHVGNVLADRLQPIDGALIAKNFSTNPRFIKTNEGLDLPINDFPHLSSSPNHGQQRNALQATQTNQGRRNAGSNADSGISMTTPEPDTPPRQETPQASSASSGHEPIIVVVKHDLRPRQPEQHTEEDNYPPDFSIFMDNTPLQPIQTGHSQREVHETSSSLPQVPNAGNQATGAVNTVQNLEQFRNEQTGQDIGGRLHSAMAVDTVVMETSGQRLITDTSNVKGMRSPTDSLSPTIRDNVQTSFQSNVDTQLGQGSGVKGATEIQHVGDISQQMVPTLPHQSVRVVTLTGDSGQFPIQTQGVQGTLEGGTTSSDTNGVASKIGGISGPGIAVKGQQEKPTVVTIHQTPDQQQVAGPTMAVGQTIHTDTQGLFQRHPPNSFQNVPEHQMSNAQISENVVISLNNGKRNQKPVMDISDQGAMGRLTESGGKQIGSEMNNGRVNAGFGTPAMGVDVTRFLFGNNAQMDMRTGIMYLDGKRVPSRVTSPESNVGGIGGMEHEIPAIQRSSVKVVPAETQDKLVVEKINRSVNGQTSPIPTDTTKVC